MVDKNKALPKKCIVETRGEIGLLSPHGESIIYGRPALVYMSEFVEIKLQEKQLKVLAREIPASAENAEWLKHWRSCNKDMKLAVDSFCALFGQDKDGSPIETEVKPKTGE